MRGTFFGIEIGRTGLSTAQYGLDNTGHNIANTDTLGYTRQRIVQTAYDPYSTIGKFAPIPGHALVGGGTRIQILDQVRSAYLDRRFRTESTQHAYWETRTQSMSYMESFFDNANEKTSINYSMAEFFRSMSILATDPISGAPRTLMQTTAMDMVQQLNMIYQGLVDLQESENRQINTKVQKVNEMLIDMAELNKQIYVFEVTGMIANDLRDKRNILVDQLAEYVDIEYEEYRDIYDNDMFRVKIAGVTVVDHVDYAQLGTRKIPNPIVGEDPVYEVYWADLFDDSGIKGRQVDWSLIEGGQIKAHLDLRDGNLMRPLSIFDPALGQIDPNTGMPLGAYALELTNDSRYKGIPYYIEMVNDLCRALVQEINAQHRLGWSDHPLGSKTGINFFEEKNEWVSWVDDGGNEYTWDPLATFTYTDRDGNTQTGTGGWAFGTFVVTQHPETGEFINGLGDPIDYADERYNYDTPPTAGNPPANTLYRVLDINKITAKEFDLDFMIKDNAFNIACSSMPISRAASDSSEETQRHNNENIKAIYDLFRATGLYVERMGPDGNMRRVNIESFDDYASVIRFDLGNTLHTAKQTGETARVLKLSAENQRTSVAGVSLDEEMVGIVKYQHAYNGASRVITAMDEALDRLINGTGRVGL